MITSQINLLDKEGLKEALNLPSTRTVDALRSKRKIPYLRLGYRTLRYDLDAVKVALAKLTVKEVGR